MEHPNHHRRGEGAIYTRPRSPYLWIKYYKAGKPIRESTRTGDFREAARFLRQRLAEVESNPADSPRIEQLADELFVITVSMSIVLCTMSRRAGASISNPALARSRQRNSTPGSWRATSTGAARSMPRMPPSIESWHA